MNRTSRPAMPMLLVLLLLASVVAPSLALMVDSRESQRGDPVGTDADELTADQVSALDALGDNIHVGGRAHNSSAEPLGWEWVETVGTPPPTQNRASVYGAAIDSVGNVWVVGSFQSNATFGSSFSLVGSGGWDVFVAKLSRDGSWLWVLKAGGAGTEWGGAVGLDSSGNGYITGISYGNEMSPSASFGSTTLPPPSGQWNNIEAFVAKVSSAGSWEWAVSLGGERDDFVVDISVDSGGDSIISGYFCSAAIGGCNATFGSTNLTTRGEGDIFVAKLDSSGNWKWVSGAGSTSADRGYSVEIDSNGDILLTGLIGGSATFGTINVSNSGSPSFTDTVFISKMSSGGVWEWVVAGGGTYAIGQTLTIDSNSDVYVVGTFSDTASFGVVSLTSAGDDDVFVAKVSTTGAWMWAVSAGGTGTESGVAIAVDSSGNAYATGSFSESATFGNTNLTSSGETDVFVAKLTSSGAWQWAISAGGPNSDSGYGITVESSGKIFVTGSLDRTPASFGNISVGTGWPDIGFVASLSPDHDGDSTADISDSDDDDDGVPDTSDGCPMGELGWLSNSTTDHDSDGCEDDSSEDTDDDNDGLSDSADDCFRGDLNWTSDAATDHDGDGCQDAGEDSDDDNDGVDDDDDSCSTGDLSWTSGPSTDHDSDGCRDDGIEDLDDDDDLVADADDLCARGALNWTSNSTTDHDGDGCNDETEDLDDDNDGFPDDLETACGSNQTDAADTPPDLDLDGTCDALDDDIDDDGTDNDDDAFPFDSSETTDTDGDGIGDNADPDDDGDSWSDVDEVACATNSTDNTSIPLDTDGDGACDPVDTDDDADGWDDSQEIDCGTDPLEQTSTPTDTDGDGTCDSLSEDDDGDGWSDTQEAECGTDPLDQASTPTDTDGDLQCDAVDEDDDGDGVDDTLDAFPLDSSETVDTDGDGTGDNADLDDDGDGVADTFDVCAGTASGTTVGETGCLYTPAAEEESFLSANGMLLAIAAFVLVTLALVAMILSRKRRDSGGEERAGVVGFAGSSSIDLVGQEVQAVHFCTLCQGRMKPTAPGATCGGCGKPYHASCAERTDTCVKCGTAL